MAKVVEGHRRYCLLNCSLLVYIAHLNWKHQIYLTKLEPFILYVYAFLFFGFQIFGIQENDPSRHKDFLWS
jgi:hypothetical protein